MRAKLWIGAIALVVLSGCSSKFGYNNLDWLLYWYLDDYIELDKQQKAIFDDKLDVWLDWHRKEELAKYKGQLEGLKSQLNTQALTQQQWLEQFAQGREHWNRLRDKLAPELSDMAVQLSDEQVTDLFEKLEDDNLDEIEEREKVDPEERDEKQVKRIEKQVKQWIGKLTSEQKQIVAEYSPQFRSNFDNWIQYRRDIQAAAKTLFESRNNDPEFSGKLLAMLTNPEAFQQQAFLENSEHNRQLSAQMMSELNQTLTNKQKKHFNRELDDLIDDLDDLIRD